jgi:hypothetical protein
MSTRTMVSARGKSKISGVILESLDALVRQAGAGFGVRRPTIASRGRLAGVLLRRRGGPAVVVERRTSLRQCQA